MMLSVNLTYFKSFTIAALLTMQGCASHLSFHPDPRDLLHDQGFAGYQNIAIEQEQQIFYLDDDAKQFVKQAIAGVDDPARQIKSLVKHIFGHADFNLLYDPNANTVAMETFNNRSANCLSMSIMTYALAEEAGFGVSFQEILIPEYWTRRNGYSLLNGHINLRLIPDPGPNVYQFYTRGFQVDFDPQSVRQNLPKKLVDKHTVVAMFYNNKGADALVQRDYVKAYAYFRQAFLTDPYFDSALVNLGIVYRLHQMFDKAEQSYQYALALNPNNLTAWENLAFLFKGTGREQQAQQILSRIERQRESNPYYHLNLGEQELELGHYELALQHLKTALSLDRKRHEVYFALARAYYLLGEAELTEHYLRLAKDFAGNARDEQRYQGKLNMLSRL